MLKDDILLDIFNHYRLSNEDTWNFRLGWCKLSHVCRRWHYLILESAFYLGIHILCTNDTPTVDTLDHLPPLPLFVFYVLRGEGELGILCHALQLHDRVWHLDLDLCLLPSILDKALRLMDPPFPILESLYLSLINDGTTSVVLPLTFLAPKLRHLSLLGIRLPKRLRLLSSTTSLITLQLSNIQASGYFHPRLLVARLESLPQLEKLTIEFFVPIPRPSTEGVLLGKHGTPRMLSNLKSLTFRGVSAYLEGIVSQIRAPILERLDIVLFNQLAFRLPYLSHFISITEQIKFPGTAAVSFVWRDSIILRHRIVGRSLFSSHEPFILRVMCQPLDWQIDCATQICNALMSVLTVEKLSIKYHLSEFEPRGFERGLTNMDDIDSTTWHELLRSFIGVEELCVDHRLSEELSRALEAVDIGHDPGFLPNLQEIVCESREDHSHSLFRAFIHARQVSGRPVSFRLPFSPTMVFDTHSISSRKNSVF